MALLELEGVEARYGPIKALHGVSLAVGEGELVALLGANGAGKTTTLRAVSGTVRRTGRISLAGRSVERRSSERPASEIRPARRTVPETARSVVVFPAPFGPRYPKTSPSRTARSTASTSSTSAGGSPPASPPRSGTTPP